MHALAARFSEAELGARAGLAVVARDGLALRALMEVHFLGGLRSLDHWGSSLLSLIRSIRSYSGPTNRFHAAQKRFATSIRTFVTHAVSDRLTHSSIACPPPPPAPNTTPGIPPP